jgi:hypothetical protein
MTFDGFVAGQIVLLPFLDYFSGGGDYNEKLCLPVCRYNPAIHKWNHLLFQRSDL